MGSPKIEEFKDIKETYKELLSELDTKNDKINVISLYAFNGTGKTRISREFQLLNDKVTCFNSLFQDNFTWDNNQYILKINKDSNIANDIRILGIQDRIMEIFENIYGDMVIPEFRNENEIVFNGKIKDGYDYNIKISKGEETLFIWSIFYSILESAIENLKQVEENRTTSKYNNLEYIVIDDPVSSVDDNLIIKIAISIVELILSILEEDKNKIGLRVIILTHHALFYNVIYNLLNRENKIKLKSYILNKKIDTNYELIEKRDTAFGYHLEIRREIEAAIKNNVISRKHFNMFRILMEKTANYFEYGPFDKCLPESEYKKEVVYLSNLYSHGNLPRLEPIEITDHEKEIFKKAYKDFENRYFININ